MKKAEPTDIVLYEEIKKKIYIEMPRHSAYRSGHLVRTYKKAFDDKYNKNKKLKKEPYKNTKPDVKLGLRRWFLEDWRNQDDTIGYTKKQHYYRPTKRITAKTPITHSELNEKQKKKAMRLKRNGKRADFT